MRRPWLQALPGRTPSDDRRDTPLSGGGKRRYQRLETHDSDDEGRQDKSPLLTPYSPGVPHRRTDFKAWKRMTVSDEGTQTLALKLLSAVMCVIIFLVIVILTRHSAPATHRPSVTVRNGTYLGAYDSVHHQDHFLGIPFAEPPVGALRWRNPRPFNQSWHGTRLAAKYGHSCWGSFSQDISEDCLLLHVIRPANMTNRRLPVVAWIHGGAFKNGNNDMPRLNLSYIVQNSVEVGKPIMAVAINYRLSIYGVLNSVDLIKDGDTNLALRDQRLALQWVQENIHAFGGDPKKVTMWGVSAGAASIGLQLLAYGGRNDSLFSGAMMDSGGPVPYTAMRNATYYQTLQDRLSTLVGCGTGTMAISCLRQATAQQLEPAVRAFTAFQVYPIIDNDFIQDYPSRQLKQGKFVPVPVLIGANTDEGTSFTSLGLNMETQANWEIQTSGGYFPGIALKWSLAEQISKLYPYSPCVGIPSYLGCRRMSGRTGKHFRRIAEYKGDAAMIAGRRLTCESWSQQNATAYCYRFDANEFNPRSIRGATHLRETPFVFANIEFIHRYIYRGLSDRQAKSQHYLALREVYYDLAKHMSYSWASFVHDQDPNSFHATATYNFSKPLTEWPAYDHHHPRNYVFDTLSYTEWDTYRSEAIALINREAISFLR